MVPVVSRALRGFTLIEVLVVLAIVGTLVGLVVSLLRPDPERLAEAEAWRLARLAARLVQESELTGQEYALNWSPEGYRFLRRGDDGTWAAWQNDDVFAPRTIPSPLRLADSGELRVLPETAQKPQKWRLQGETFDLLVSLSTIGEASVARPSSETRDQ